MNYDSDTYLRIATLAMSTLVLLMIIANHFIMKRVTRRTLRECEEVVDRIDASIGDAVGWLEKMNGVATGMRQLAVDTREASEAARHAATEAGNYSSAASASVAQLAPDLDIIRTRMTALETRIGAVESSARKRKPSALG